MSDPGDMPRRLRYSRRGFLRRGVFVSGVRLAGLFCVFVLQVLLARLIADPGEYGRYAWGQSLLFLVGNLACIGLPVVTSRFVAALWAQRNEAAARQVVRGAARLLARSTAAVLAGACLLGLLWRDPQGISAYRDAAIIALFFAPAVTFNLFLRDVARARQWLGLALLPLQVLRPTLTAIFALIAWYLLAQRLSGVVALALAGLSLVLVLAGQAWLLRRRLGRIVAAEGPAAPAEYHPAALVRTALPVFVTRCAGLVITYANVLLVGFLAGPGAAGVYFAAERLASLAGIPTTVVSTVNQQAMAAAHAVRNERELQLLATQSAHGALWPTLLIALVLALFPEPLLGLFGDGFVAAGAVLIILSVNATIGAFVGPVQDVLLMTGRQQLIPGVMVVSAVSHVAALLFLVPSHGALGAACASVFSSLISRTWLLHIARRDAGIDTTVLGLLRRRS